MINQVKPDVVLGLGGYASAPGGVAAWLLGKPLVLHEQNAVAGMSNRYLSKIAKRVLCAFPNAFKTKVGAEVVGNPLRKEMVELEEKMSKIQNDVQKMVTKFQESKFRPAVTQPMNYDEETVFWQALFDLIGAEGKQLTFISVSEPGTDIMTDFEKHPAVTDYRTSLEEIPPDENKLIFVRMARIPTSEEVLYLKRLEVYYLLNSPSVAERSTTQYKSEIMRKLLGPASGLLIIDHEAVHTLPRIMKWVELLLLNILFSKKSKSDVE